MHSVPSSAPTSGDEMDSDDEDDEDDMSEDDLEDLSSELAGLLEDARMDLADLHLIYSVGDENGDVEGEGG